MRYVKIICITLLAMIPVLGNAQSSGSHGHKAKHHVIKTNTAPYWAAAHKYDATAHVYFPDFHSFYDAGRQGYVYQENGVWNFTPSVPAYMSKIDLGKERIQILKGISLDLQPEFDYPRYMKLYPADHEYNGVSTQLPIAGQ